MFPRRLLLISSTALWFALPGCEREEEASSPPPRSAPERDQEQVSDRGQPSESSVANRPSRPSSSSDRPEGLPEITAENALQLREQLREKKSRWRMGMKAFYSEWASVNPKAAVEAAMAEDYRPQNAMISALSSWAMNDPGAAGEWLASQPAGADRENKALLVFNDWPNGDMASLGAWVDSYSTATESSELQGRLVDQWSQTDPAGAAGYLGDKDSDAFTDGATEALYSGWAKSNPDEAGEFLAENTDFRNWSTAANSYAMGLAASSPRRAIRWIESIEDDSLKALLNETAAQLQAGLDQ